MSGFPEPGLDIRPATPGDADAIADVWLRSRRASIPAIPPSVHDDDDVRAWLAAMARSSRELWVAEGAGILAMMLLDGQWIDQLYVDPTCTGHGIGSRLLAEAKLLHPDRLDLWTFQSNAGARRFYERHGFVPREMTDGDNEEGAPDVHYTWVPAVEFVLGSPTPAATVALSFVGCINRGDVAGLGQLMAEDHELQVFGEEPLRGREANVAGWQGYLDAFPYYVIHPHRVAVEDGRVAVLGHTTGSHLGFSDDEEIPLTLIWLVEVTDAGVRSWTLVEDTADNRVQFGLGPDDPGVGP